MGHDRQSLPVKGYGAGLPPRQGKNLERSDLIVRELEDVLEFVRAPRKINRSFLPCCFEERLDSVLPVEAAREVAAGKL